MLHDESADDFGVNTLSARVTNPTVRILLLPNDPLGTPVVFDDEFWQWLEQHHLAHLDDWILRFGSHSVPTAHAAAIVNGPDPSMPWRGYVATHRSGAIELELGDRGGWNRSHPNGENRKQFNLITIVGYAWAFLALAEALDSRSPLSGPFQLTVALVGTRGAALGNFGEGWLEPSDFRSDVRPCVDTNLLWHIELDELPTGLAQRDTAFAVGDLLENAWGSHQRRYLNYRGQRKDEIDPNRIVE